MVTRVLLGTIAIALTLGAMSCGGKSASAPATAQPPVTMAVTGVKAAVAPIRHVAHLLGNTVAQRQISLRSPTAGMVVGLNIQVGDHVRRNQVVAHVINREVQAVESGLAVAKKIDPSEARALARKVEPFTKTQGIPVLAPASGIVSQRLVSSGQRVADLDVLADLIDPASIYVEAAVPLDDLSLIRPGMPATVGSSVTPGIEYPARVAAISPTFALGGATTPARIDFAGERRILEANAPVEVAVTTAYMPDALVIPEAALFEDPATNQFYVFVAGPDGLAHRRTVTLGIHNQTEAQVTSGLRRGEIVITSGGYALSDGLRVRVENMQTAQGVQR
ncbi:MAG: efflux RND transporter periplasmic adaptor subunit [Candidatus Binataceae bacterium]